MHRFPKNVIVGTLVLTLLAVSPTSGEALEEGPVVASRHSQDHVLVEVADHAGAMRLGSGRSALGDGWYAVPVPAGVDPAEFVEDLSARVGVRHAELDLVFHSLVTVPFTPNDPLYTAGAGNPAAQWHLHVIDLTHAWQTTVGGGVEVAVLDSGVTPGPDGFCQPFIAEYDATTDTEGPGSAADDDGHGTHVAGSVAQCSGNGQGGAGVATDARIMPIDVFIGDVALSSDIVRGIDHAIANGADVINLSLGIEVGSSEILNQAIARAVEADIVIVAASGNNGGALFYPANHPDVIAVGATTITNSVPSYSSRGVGLELVAPGGTGSAPVWQETGGVYQGLAGTSMASAHVSGVAALLRARHPAASAAQVRNAMNCSAADLGSAGWDSDSGFGLVQAGDAVDELGEMVASGGLTCDSVAAGSSKVGTIETATGIWRLYLGSTQIASFYYGNPGDLGFFGDWDCDGVETPGLYRQSDG
ncbi:MAG: S8 family serine peptidase, partial [Actinobacteria bacterium]|nr:S8 family serine peptidase [Actinomycetota bacterium]